jgi:DNA gyrase inhibitor GyrI
MVVDFEIKRAPSYNVASILKVGPYREDNLRTEFGELMKWAKKNGLRTGKWIMYEHDGPNSRRGMNQRRWEACLEIRGKAAPDGRIKIKKLPAQNVASVVFNPNVVSSRIVYHGLGDWIWWRLKYKDIKRAGPTREVYEGDPWTSSKAWSKVDVQVLVEK